MHERCEKVQVSATFRGAGLQPGWGTTGRTEAEKPGFLASPEASRTPSLKAAPSSVRAGPPGSASRLGARGRGALVPPPDTCGCAPTSGALEKPVPAGPPAKVPPAEVPPAGPWQRLGAAEPGGWGLDGCSPSSPRDPPVRTVSCHVRSRALSGQQGTVFVPTARAPGPEALWTRLRDTTWYDQEWMDSAHRESLLERGLLSGPPGQGTRNKDASGQHGGGGAARPATRRPGVGGGQRRAELGRTPTPLGSACPKGRARLQEGDVCGRQVIC